MKSFPSHEILKRRTREGGERWIKTKRKKKKKLFEKQIFWQGREVLGFPPKYIIASSSSGLLSELRRKVSLYTVKTGSTITKVDSHLGGDENPPSIRKVHWTFGGSLCRSLSIASGGGCTWDIRRSVKFKFPFSIIKENCFEESFDRKGELCCWFSALGEFFRNIFVYAHRSRNPSFALQSRPSECKKLWKNEFFRRKYLQ